MAEAIGVDKEKPNKPLTVAVKMLKGEYKTWSIDNFNCQIIMIAVRLELGETQ